LQASQVNKFKARLPKHALYTYVSAMFSNAKRGMVKGIYDPVTDPRMMAVFDDLTWLHRPPVLSSSALPEKYFTT
jgi:hypothetical protein